MENSKFSYMQFVKNGIFSYIFPICWRKCMIRWCAEIGLNYQKVCLEEHSEGFRMHRFMFSKSFTVLAVIK